MYTTKVVAPIAPSAIRIAVPEPISPLRTSWAVPATAAGTPATMPARMIIEMPLPTPRSVICSPSHIRNIVPVTSVMQAVIRNDGPGFTTTPGCACSQEAAATDWNSDRATVP